MFFNCPKILFSSFILLSANGFKLDWSENISFGKELRQKLIKKLVLKVQLFELVNLLKVLNDFKLQSSLPFTTKT